ncbi:MAG: hypothetical protein HC866_00475 [Leptolyngbyaceae cyanobacterium RU_5_1]|nr:hypothetical protein [Leptolyngbyaceae cyanobacterium RU_5_1]
MKRQLWLGFGVLALVVGCSGSSDENRAQSPTTQPTIVAAQQNFSNPLVSPSARSSEGQLPSVPGLLQPTNPKARIPTIATGRNDPFAVIPSSTPILISSNRSSPNLLGSRSPASSGRSLPSAKLPQSPVAVGYPIAPLPSLPVPPAGSPLPPVTVPNTPGMATPPSPTSLAEAIEVSGVVQVRGKWNVIVKEPNASSSRYVSVGDYLENGKVLVKRILATSSSEPVIVLQQNGVEIRKSLG